MLKERAKSSGLALFFCLSLIACASRTETADQWARTGHLTKSVVSTSAFDIATWSRTRTTPDQPLIVYIEGDGLSFISATRISDDPTPVIPLALQLAAQDDRPNVVYLSRPCQFVTGSQRRGCHPAYWTDHRYAEVVVTAMNTVVDYHLKRSGARGIQVIGYSGGGAIATLLAARRGDVQSLMTVAGVLDHEAWTRDDGMTPLAGSLNPADYADRLSSIAQVHLAGAKDDQVPPSVARAFAARFTRERAPKLVVLPNAGHECCWVEQWQSLLRTYRPQ